MSLKSKQTMKRFIEITGYIVIPVLFILTGIFSTQKHMNITGLLNNGKYQIYAYFTCLLLFIWMNYVLHEIYRSLKKELWILNLLIVCALFIPYIKDNPWISFLHVASAYMAFVIFSIMILHLCFNHKHLNMLYIAGIVTAFLSAMTAGGITALSECIIAIDASIVLTTLYVLKNR